MELLFVAGFFLMLLVTGVSVIGVLAALLVATVLMTLSGFLLLMFKLLPWLLLAVAVAWIYQTFFAVKQSRAAPRSIDKTLEKVNRMNKRW